MFVLVFLLLLINKVNCDLIHGRTIFHHNVPPFPSFYECDQKDLIKKLDSRSIIPGPMLCSRWCYDTPGCKIFVYNNALGRCSLYRECHEIQTEGSGRNGQQTKILSEISYYTSIVDDSGAITYRSCSNIDIYSTSSIAPANTMFGCAAKAMDLRKEYFSFRAGICKILKSACNLDKIKFENGSPLYKAVYIEPSKVFAPTHAPTDAPTQSPTVKYDYGTSMHGWDNFLFVSKPTIGGVGNVHVYKPPLNEPIEIAMKNNDTVPSFCGENTKLFNHNDKQYLLSFCPTNIKNNFDANNELRLYDVTNPYNLKLIRSYGKAQDLFAAGGGVYAVCRLNAQNSTLELYDIQTFTKIQETNVPYCSAIIRANDSYMFLYSKSTSIVTVISLTRTGTPVTKYENVKFDIENVNDIQLSKNNYLYVIDDSNNYLKLQLSPKFSSKLEYIPREMCYDFSPEVFLKTVPYPLQSFDEITKDCSLRCTLLEPECHATMVDNSKCYMFKHCQVRTQSVRQSSFTATLDVTVYSDYDLETFLHKECRTGLINMSPLYFSSNAFHGCSKACYEDYNCHYFMLTQHNDKTLCTLYSDECTPVTFGMYNENILYKLIK